jgi:hypothetical protein
MPMLRNVEANGRSYQELSRFRCRIHVQDRNFWRGLTEIRIHLLPLGVFNFGENGSVGFVRYG